VDEIGGDNEPVVQIYGQLLDISSVSAVCEISTVAVITANISADPPICPFGMIYQQYQNP
jgi:hypothetical protein